MDAIRLPTNLAKVPKICLAQASTIPGPGTKATASSAVMPAFVSTTCHRASDAGQRLPLPELALTSLFRGRSNSFSYRRTNGLIQLLLKPGSSRRVTMSAARGGAVLGICGSQGAVGRNRHVRNLRIAAAARHDGPDPHDSRLGQPADHTVPVLCTGQSICSGCLR